MDNEKLIECVKENNFLYNQENQYYSDNIKKDAAWEEIGKIVKHSGAECKKHWNNLRDAYRRAIKRSKETKSGQAATKQKKWKFEELMSFLIPYMRERETITSVAVDLSQDNTDDDEIDAVNEATNNSTERREHVSPAEKTPVKKNVRKKIKNQSETASSTLMKYLLDKGKVDTTNEIDLFFKSMAGTVKKLSPFNQSLAKSRVLKVVSELEMEELSQQEPWQLAASVSSERAEVPRLSYSSSDSSVMHPPSPLASTSCSEPKIRRKNELESNKDSSQQRVQQSEKSKPCLSRSTKIHRRSPKDYPKQPPSPVALIYNTMASDQTTPVKSISTPSPSSVQSCVYPFSSIFGTQGTSQTIRHIVASTPSPSDSQSNQEVAQFYIDFTSNLSENKEF